eukprot:TRINITY_DN27613_c0_g1_i1.p1 TRINITY_DN27613_c0_g1~~TRINITY_DN27613_c0_g1_i1.p1  ORF type:complete len:247 (-),score=44.26 TRINITY_DN27613_c0_g1_i1:40-780(-)
MSYSHIHASLISESLSAPPPFPSPAIAQLLEAGAAYHNAGAAENALDTYEMAHQEWLKHCGPMGDIPPSVEVYFLLVTGQVLQSHQRDDLALQRYLLARQIVDRGPLERVGDIAFVFSSMANAYYQLREREKALIYYRKACKIREDHLGRNHPDTAALYNNIAVCMISYGVGDDKDNQDHAAVQRLYVSAREILLRELGEQHPRTITVTQNIEKEKRKGLVVASQKGLRPLPPSMVSKKPTAKSKR